MSHMRSMARALLAAAISFFILAATAASGQEAAGGSNPGESSPKDGGLDKTKVAADRAPEASEKNKSEARTKKEVEPEFVRKSDAEWRRILTRYQYAVTRQKATEPAYSGKYATGHYRGTFVCVCCGATLFSAQTKFESGTGWPSFFRAASAKAIQTAWDYDGAEPRVEVTCRRCGAHLGHVFDDGPAPTGLRFCINSIAIKNVPPAGESPAGQSTRVAKTRTAARSRTAAKAKTKMTSSSKARSKSTAAKTTGSSATAKSTAATTTPSTAGSESTPATQPPRASDN